MKQTINIEFGNTLEVIGNDVVAFGDTFHEFVVWFREEHNITLTESKLRNRLSTQALDLLGKMKRCCSRLEKDIESLEHCSSYNLTPSKKDYVIWRFNVRDLLQTCENTLSLYEGFIRKDLKPLRDTFDVFIRLLKRFDNIVQKYNSTTDKILPVIDNSYTTLNKIVNLGFEITTIETMSFQDFSQKYKQDGVDEKYLKYLEFLQDPLNERTEWEWMEPFLEYLDSFEED